jgi:peptidyl-prolyl cis-trans isomerase D
MLTTIRDKAQGWIAWVIVILISVPFALWGINEYFDAEKKVPVAEIDGNELMTQDFQRQLQRQKNTIRQKFGGRIDSKLFETPAFKQQVLNEMLTERLVIADIRKQNYQISDQQLASFLRSNPAFQANGAFSPELYQQAVRTNGLNPAAFESQIRMGSIVGQIKEGFVRSVISNEAEVDELLRLQQEKRNFSSLSLSAKSFIDQIDIDEDEIKKHYDSNQKQYMTADEVRVEYITLSLAEIADQIQPDEEALRTFYEESKDQYVQAEQRKAQHILLTLTADASDEESKRIQDQASDLASQAQGGKDFAELAKQFSVDSISSEQGGDLGYFEKGVMDAAFDEQVFSMQQGEISGPVRSRFGIHIIKLNEIKPETGKSFDQIKEEISKQYALREASLRYGQMAEELQNIVFEQPTTLQPAADALGLKVASTEWFSRAGGQGIAKVRPFIDSAFTEDVLLEGLNSEVIETSEDTLVALRLLKHRQPQQIQLTDISDDIKQMLIKQHSKQLVAIEADKLLKSLQSGNTTLAKIAETEGLQLTDHADISRSGNAGLSAVLLRGVFSSPANAAGEDKAARSVQLENGDYAIFSVTKVLPGNPQDVPENIRNEIRSVLAQRRGEDLFSDYERGLFESSEIVIHEDKL